MIDTGIAVLSTHHARENRREETTAWWRMQLETSLLPAGAGALHVSEILLRTWFENHHDYLTNGSQGQAVVVQKPDFKCVPSRKRGLLAKCDYFWIIGLLPIFPHGDVAVVVGPAQSITEIYCWIFCFAGNTTPRGMVAGILRMEPLE